MHSTEACVKYTTPCSLQRDGNLTTSIQLQSEHTQASPFVFALPPCEEKVRPLSRSLVCIPVDIHTHPLLQRNVSYFWAPKVSQTSSLFLMLDSLDHCVFFPLIWEDAVCFDLQPQSLFIYKELLFSAVMRALLESGLGCVFCQTQLDLIFQGSGFQ